MLLNIFDEQHLYKIEIFFNTTKDYNIVLTVIFDQVNASLLNKNTKL